LCKKEIKIFKAVNIEREKYLRVNQSSPLSPLNLCKRVVEKVNICGLNFLVDQFLRIKLKNADLIFVGILKDWTFF